MADWPPKGNKYAVGNKGGGGSTFKDTLWHIEKWEKESELDILAAKIASRKYSVRDMFLFKALGGDKELLRVWAAKNVPDTQKVELTAEHGALQHEHVISLDAPTAKLIHDFEEQLRKTYVQKDSQESSTQEGSQAQAEGESGDSDQVTPGQTGLS